uniref:RING-CH-type domain-containing protein n=1 Tax=Kalanchoe fedtschenkoi TaxID=63787 RepID=A0A7N0V5T0_KALFE
MQLISNNASKENYSEIEPILHVSNVGEVSDEVSGCDIGIMSFVSSSSDDTGHLHSNVSCNLVIEDPPQCRICLDVGDELLIAPCYCKGTQKYVHRSCIDNWRSTKARVCFLSLYRMQGIVYVACKCSTRSPVAKAKISVSCREGPCTHICCCPADCGILRVACVQVLWSGTQTNVWL